MSKKTIFLALNELNFEFIQRYIDLGHLKAFKHLFEKFGYKETTSESEYKLLEPWIQWVTVHTGKTYAEHEVFRLGDIVNRPDLTQLWEIAEEKGLSVGAISPFNVDNRLENAKFFVPDPWTQTKVSGEKFLHQAAEALAQAVNDNAQGGVTAKSVLAILKTAMKVIPVSGYTGYLGLASQIKSKIGIKAVILDKLLANVFLHQWNKHQPDFSSLFLNTGAHLQHHYMFNSVVYDGGMENPNWYCPKDQDPLLLILKEYDQLINDLLNLDVRLIISTGLHQKPHLNLTYYWRLKQHEDFLRKIGITDYSSVTPRMSRDFLIEFKEENLAVKAQTILESLRAEADDMPLFTIDNRGKSLFVELTYSKDIPKNFAISGGVRIEGFEDDVVFVAIKNGEHDGVGYFIDTHENSLSDQFPLAQVFDHIVDTF